MLPVYLAHSQSGGTPNDQNNLFSIDSIVGKKNHFLLKFNLNSINNCEIGRLEIQKGSLTLINIDGIFLEATINNENPEKTIIDKIPLGVSNGGAINAPTMELAFPNGITCDQANQEIKVLFGCSGNTPISSQIQQVKGNDILNRAKIIFTQETNTNSSLCYSDNVILYKIQASNPEIDSKYRYLISDAKITAKLPPCAKLIGLYQENSYTPVSFVVPSENSLVWGIPEINKINQNFDLYVQYPCETCVPQTSMIHPTVSLSGNFPEGCSLPPLNTLPIAPSNGSEFSNSQCEKCDGEVFVLNANAVSNFPCDTCPLDHAYVQIKSNISPDYHNKKASLLVEIPIPLRDKLISNPFENATYYYNNKWNATVEPNSSVEKVHFIMDTPINLIKNISFKNTQVSNLDINYYFYSDSIITPFNQIGKFIIKVKSESCTPNLIVDYKVKINTSNTFANKIYANPGETVTFRIKVINNGRIELSNINLKHLLSDKLLYAGQFRYAYTNESNPLDREFYYLQESLSEIKNFPNGNSNVFVQRPALNQTGEISLASKPNFILPYNCTDYKYLYLEFDAQLSKEVSAGDVLLNNLNVYTEQTDSRESKTEIVVNNVVYATSNIYVKCPVDNEWTALGVKQQVFPEKRVRNGDKIQYKMEFMNRGSVPLKVTDLVNNKPHPEDQTEFKNILRGSEMTINYSCETPVTLPAGGTVSYASSLDNSSSTGSLWNTWSQTSCEQANWMKISFDQGYILNPGQKIEIIYDAVAVGESGRLGNNSFAFRVLRLDGSLLKSDDSNIVSVKNDQLGCTAPPECKNCASFDLVPKEKYLVSAWVKEEYENNPYLQFKKYENSSVLIGFSDKIDKNKRDNISFFPTGNIIDGWQRITGEFVVPETADDFFLELVNSSNDERVTYFDDVRIIPSKGSMKSFVYDQKTQRLMAELDENNYSTYYEYDLEGGLIRIKKETEKGVFTIQETRSGNAKKQ